ncbi:MAG: hypothetical protein Q8N44_17910 [Rubrivivax sp.]|nr:hypothetical protein [Rubrivivax sp.]
MALKRLTKGDHPQSFGAFKPVGHAVVGLPDEACAIAVVHDLLQAGFDAEDILEYSAAEERAEMASMLQHTSNFAGFGYELTLMRRYQQLAQQGASWLVVFAPEPKQAATVAEVAKRHGALTAEKYHRLVIEDLI